jgi:hypothetical protein
MPGFFIWRPETKKAEQRLGFNDLRGWDLVVKLRGSRAPLSLTPHS